MGLGLDKICFVQRCDKDGNGKLDYDEFKALIFRYKTRKEDAVSEEEDRLGKKQITKEPKKLGKTKIKGKGGKGKAYSVHQTLRKEH